MSKMYQRYLELKIDSKKKMYLFECGNFYIFLDEDARKINELFDLKLTEFSKNVVKCGFPKGSFMKYMQLFKMKKLKVEVIENENKNKNILVNKVSNNDSVLEVIKKIDLNNLTPLQAFNVIKELKEMID